MEEQLVCCEFFKTASGKSINVRKSSLVAAAAKFEACNVETDTMKDVIEADQSLHSDSTFFGNVIGIPKETAATPAASACPNSETVLSSNNRGVQQEMDNAEPSMMDVVEAGSLESSGIFSQKFLTAVQELDHRTDNTASSSSYSCSVQPMSCVLTVTRIYSNTLPYHKPGDIQVGTVKIEECNMDLQTPDIEEAHAPITIETASQSNTFVATHKDAWVVTRVQTARAVDQQRGTLVSIFNPVSSISLDALCEGHSYKFTNMKSSMASNHEVFMETTKETTIIKISDDADVTLCQRRPSTLKDVLELDGYSPLYNEVDIAAKVTEIRESGRTSGDTYIIIKDQNGLQLSICVSHGLKKAVGLGENVVVGKILCFLNLRVCQPLTSINQVLFCSDLTEVRNSSIGLPHLEIPFEQLQCAEMSWNDSSTASAESLARTPGKRKLNAEEMPDGKRTRTA